MNEGLKLALIGVGGYFLYEYLFGSSSVAAPAAVSSGTAGSSIAPSGVVSTSNSNTPASKSGGQVIALANEGTLMNSSQWNYYQNIDNPGGNIILGGPNVPTGNISYAQWQAAFNLPGTVVGPQPSPTQIVGKVGSGRTMAGLGHIINLQDLIEPSQIGWGVGEDEFDYGLGAILMGAKPGVLGFRGIEGFGGIVDDPANNAAYVDEGVFIDAASTNGGLDSSSQDFYLAAGLPIK